MSVMASEASANGTRPRLDRVDIGASAHLPQVVADAPAPSSLGAMLM
jgi:hypothetical protein